MVDQQQGRVLIDAHMLGDQEGGNETYIAGLLQGFESLGQLSDAKIIALYNQHYKPLPYTHIGMRRFSGSGALKRLLCELPAVSRREDADLLHVTYNAPLRQPCPVVVSVHDVIFRRYPGYFSPRVRLLLNTILPLSMRRARAVFTLSEASRRDIAHYYPFTRDKIHVVGLAAGPLVHAQPDDQGAQRYTRGRPFLLAVGNVQPRKNIGRLIKAYLRARQNGMQAVRLLVVGRSQWQGSAIQQLAAASPYHDDIVFTGYLQDQVVAALYRQCLAFIYPSLYEGFGLPVLEAMACGAPTVTSNSSSLPEVAGDAAILVDPTSAEAITSAIEQLVADGSLRDKLRDRGLRQAARFSWEQTARQTLEVYQQVLYQR
jgi:glycosyltransferase involved in cell wall biosynthesis